MGLALAFRYQEKKNIVACFFGHGKRIGSFHEAVNMAAIWDLPVVFVCENNLYAASTSVDSYEGEHISERAAAYAFRGRPWTGIMWRQFTTLWCEQRVARDRVPDRPCLSWKPTALPDILAATPVTTCEGRNR